MTDIGYPDASAEACRSTNQQTLPLKKRRGDHARRAFVLRFVGNHKLPEILFIACIILLAQA
jgi:hypothetical protein